MRRLLLALFAVASFCQIAQGATHSFMEENNLHLESDLTGDETYGISRNTFNEIMAKAEKIFAPIVANLGGVLDIQGDFTDSTVNAYASREGNTYIVRMFGGLAKRKEITPDGFAMVVCHELSHHIGGIPLYAGEEWASNEGNSDYVASLNCMRKMFADDTTDVKSLDPIAVNKCKAVYKGQDLRSCYHILAGAKSCADLLAALNGETVSFGKTSKVVVRKTMDTHPPAICRLQTYVAGALCSAKWDDSMIPSTKEEAYRVSCPTGEYARPRCWYAP